MNYFTPKTGLHLMIYLFILVLCRYCLRSRDLITRRIEIEDWAFSSVLWLFLSKKLLKENEQLIREEHLNLIPTQIQDINSFCEKLRAKTTRSCFINFEQFEGLPGVGWILSQYFCRFFFWRTNELFVYSDGSLIAYLQDRFRNLSEINMMAKWSPINVNLTQDHFQKWKRT